ncbi:hypothetical protein [Rhodopseudomonas sp. P2A-2r]|uniref:hypothetical protein n=1 Tax=unclassified Rhodopseudomonas TaxID=2638247 RepID=UPI002234D073|nr:hypothetical protein [Rhodopseudomonas sp. P2A-2r]UZE46743.1 hypothetical protein ONR75_16905 [Rhodopseudomonas sp. P2A-2r]
MLFAAALLLSTVALAQAPAQDAAQAQDAAPAPAARKPAARAAKPVPRPAATAAQPAEDLSKLNVMQIDALRQIDPATYEIDLRLADGKAVNLRMNAFVMQDLSRRLGNYGR